MMVDCWFCAFIFDLRFNDLANIAVDRFMICRPHSYEKGIIFIVEIPFEDEWCDVFCAWGRAEHLSVEGRRDPG
jgi:hypothetical protein